MRILSAACLAVLPLFACACATAPAAPSAASPATAPPAAAPVRVLVFSKTLGYRHGPQIVLGNQMLKEMAAKGELALDAHSGEDEKVFTDAVLAQVDVVLFLQADETPEKPLFDAAQKTAFENFIRRGGGFVGVHAASACGYRWPFYAEMLGAVFASHSLIQDAELKRVGGAKPSTEHLPDRFRQTDEWYACGPNVHGKPGVDELLAVDEKTYAPGQSAQGANHPISWMHPYAGGRAWYTALGHTEATYAQGWFRLHILGGIRWAARREK